jgi:class 3 adenylate cyclase
VKAFPFASVYSNNLIKIGTVSGIMNIQPEMLLKSDRKIGVHLQEISNDLNQINWKEYQFDDGEIIFPPEFHQLSFYVISDELAYPNGVLYRFKLEGEDDEFVSTFILSKISYSGLSSGNYKLWVQCKPPMGEWSEPKMVVGFEIETPFYKNPWLLGILFIFFVAIIYAFVWVRTKRLEIEKAKLEKLVHERTSELSAEKQKTDELLLNILPAEIADELKRNGSAEARGYEKVSILFTDFKGFTTISGKIPPKELVKDLDEIFAAFDDIVAKHDLEKIKTIGDAYMCVGGVPNVSEHHARNTILAGKDMVKFMEEFNARKRATGKDEWLIRVGVHSGPIVAGVVGKSKFAYDVWGDSVNVASRMESASEPGRINVSAETYNLAKEEFTFEYRGALQVKNKGDLDMYFVN